MEFHEKLQELRKQKGLTQEELAEALYVSRTAVSKWESGRGYPNIDSLKAMAKFFGRTIDELLSGDEWLSLAEENSRQKESGLRSLLFGLLDGSVAAVFVLPLFGQTVDGVVQAVSLLSLGGIPDYLRGAYAAAVLGLALWGVLTLALQNCQKEFWLRNKSKISLLLSTLGVLLFILGRQPYAAVFLFLFLAIKAFMLIRWP